MALEQFLRHRLYIIEAYNLVHGACQLVSFIEKKKDRYPSYLHGFLTNKDAYADLLAELGKLVDKNKLRDYVGAQGDTDDEDEEDEDVQYKRMFEDTEKLLVRDMTWNVRYYEDYASASRTNDN
jgi:hypothetical protein